MSFYVYTHRRADDGSVFYVGKGKGNRAWVSGGRSLFWQNVAAKHGLKVEVIFFGTEEECFSVEKAKIAQLRDNGARIVNLTDGGEGSSNPAPHVIEKRSASIRKAKSTPEAKARASAASKAMHKDPAFREKHSASLALAFSSRETIDRRNAAIKKSLARLEVKAKHAASVRAALSSPDVRAKISAGTKAALANPEERARRSAATSRRYQDDVERQKQSVRMKEIMSTPEAKKRVSMMSRRRNTDESPFVGIFETKTGYSPRISHDKRTIILGTFRSLDDAQAARRAAEMKMWGPA